MRCKTDDSTNTVPHIKRTRSLRCVRLPESKTNYCRQGQLERTHLRISIKTSSCSSLSTLAVNSHLKIGNGLLSGKDIECERQV